VKLSGEKRLVCGNRRHWAMKRAFADDPSRLVPVCCYDLDASHRVVSLAAKLVLASTLPAGAEPYMRKGKGKGKGMPRRGKG